jgi:hypothetical protein
MATPALPNLHDAVLERLVLDWSTGMVSVDLHPVPGDPIVLTAFGVRELHVDRWEPWGPSAFVNSAELHEAGPGQIRLRLEMQSGDPILIVAEEFELTPAESADASTTAPG